MPEPQYASIYVDIKLSKHIIKQHTFFTCTQALSCLKCGHANAIQILSQSENMHTHMLYTFGNAISHLQIPGIICRTEIWKYDGLHLKQTEDYLIRVAGKLHSYKYICVVFIQMRQHTNTYVHYVRTIIIYFLISYIFDNDGNAL